MTLSPLAYRYLVSQGRSPSASLRAEVESIVTQYFERRWTAVAPIFGTANQVLAAREAISSALTPIADVSWITDADLQSNTGLAKAILEPLVQLCQGIPTDGALDSPHWSLGHPLLDDPASLDDSQTGVRFCSPALPLDGELVQLTVDTQKEILASFDFEPYLTLNIIDDQSALLITNIVFDKSAHGEQSKANEAVHAVQQAWARLLRKLDRLGGIDWEVAMADATFAPAKKGALVSVKRRNAREPCCSY